MKKLLQIVIVFGLIVTVAGCSSKGGEQNFEADADKVENVKVALLEKQKVHRTIDLSATLQGYETMNIAPSMSGKIEHIYVEVGSRVRAGDLLVRMDQNQYNTTNLAFTNLTIEFERMKALRETGTVSQQAYDQMKLSYDQTKQSLDFITQNTFVRARIPGVISARNYEDGELFAGNPILILTQVHRLKAVISIPESYFPYVKAGMKLDLRSDIYSEQSFPCSIEIVYPTIDPSTHTFQAKLNIPNPKELLRPGMFVRTTLALGEIEALMVPYSAVLKLIGSNERYVFINDNGIAKRVTVTLGQRFDEMVEIQSDAIKSGDQIITVGQGKLVDGQKIKIEN